MATSGTYNYLVTASDVLTESLEMLGVLAPGESITSDDQTSCLRSLNMMVKQWSGNFDFAPGLKAFSKKHAYMFLQNNQTVYSLGPSGDPATLSYHTTTITTAGIASDTTLHLTDTTGMTAADKIGILLDSGVIQWTTILTVPGSTSVTIASLTSAAAVGNRVFTYTTILQRPLYIEDAVLRDTNTIDTTIYPMSQNEYENISNKFAAGNPSRYLLDNTITNATLSLDLAPNDLTYVVRMAIILPAENYDLVTNDIAYPQEWYSALACGLAKRVASKFGKNLWTQALQDDYQEALSIARTSYAETTDVYFQPGID